MLLNENIGFPFHKMDHTTKLRSTKTAFKFVSIIVRCKMDLLGGQHISIFTLFPVFTLFPAACLLLASQAIEYLHLYWLRLSAWSALSVLTGEHASLKERKNISICCILDKSYAKRKGIYFAKRSS